MSVAEEIRVAMGRRGVKWLANRTRLSPQYVQQTLDGLPVSVYAMVTIARVLDLDCRALLVKQMDAELSLIRDVEEGWQAEAAQ